jgi:amino acid transporter
MTLIVFTYGYSTFVGGFSISSFFSYYSKLPLCTFAHALPSQRKKIDANTYSHNTAMVGIAPILFVFWKVLKRTKFVKSSEADLVWETPVIDAYEASFTSPPVGFWTEILDLLRFKRSNGDVMERRASVQGV